METAIRISSHNLDKTILSDIYNRIVIESCEGAKVYLVGGYLRDLLLNRQSPDRDYVISGDIDLIAQKVRANHGGSLIRFGRVPCCRLILPHAVTLDFSLLDSDINDDLFRRDYTINALGWSKDAGLIDITGGIDDINKKLVRMIRIKNLIADPLRIIRAYRLSHDLSFNIESDTRSALRQNSALLPQVKIERITSEIFRIINSENPSSVLLEMLKDGVLDQIISFSCEDIGLEIEALSRLADKVNALPFKYSSRYADFTFHGLSRLGCLRLESLLSNSHGDLLVLSGQMRKRISKIKTALQFMRRMSLSDDDFFDLFEKCGNSSVDALIIGDKERYLAEYFRYSAIVTELFLDNDQLSAIYSCAKGREIGELFSSLRRSIWLGEIASKDDCRKFVIGYLNRI